MTAVTIICLRIQEAAMQRAAGAFLYALERSFPEGSQVRCLLRHGQQNPTTAEVLGASSDGRIRVQLFTTNRRGHRTIKRVHWTRIT